MHPLSRTYRHAVWWGVAVSGLLLTVGILMGEPRSIQLWWRTLQLSLAVAGLSLPWATLLAIFLFRCRFLGRGVLFGIVAWLMFVPLYVQTSAWQAGFGSLGWQGQIFSSAPFLEGWRGAWWVHAMAAIPWVTIIVGLGLRSVESELEENALLDASWGTVWRKITLPRAAGIFLPAALWVLFSTAGEMTVTDLFQVRTYAEELYMEIAIGEAPETVPLALLPSLAWSFWLATAGWLFFKHLTKLSREGTRRSPLLITLEKRQRFFYLAAALGMAVPAAVPIGNLIYQAGVIVTSSEAGRVREWSAAKCLSMIVESPRRYSVELRHSTLIGGASAGAALFVGYGLAWLGRKGGWRSGLGVAAAGMGLAVPGPVIGFAIIKLMNRAEWPWLLYLYDDTPFAPILAIGLRVLPLGIFVAWYVLRTIPSELIESAELDGAGPMVLFFRIIVPLKVRELGGTFVLLFVAAWGDLSASVLVLPPGIETMSKRISDMIHYGVDDRIAGVSLFLLLLLGVPCGVGGWLMRRKESF